VDDLVKAMGMIGVSKSQVSRLCVEIDERVINSTRGIARLVLDKVRVLAGPFADTITTIETLPDQARIGVLLELLGRKVKTTLPRDGIEKIS